MIGLATEYDQSAVFRIVDGDVFGSCRRSEFLPRVVPPVLAIRRECRIAVGILGVIWTESGIQ